jgi:hypothetical protein
MVAGIFKIGGLQVVIAAGAIAWFAIGGSSLAQTSGAPANSLPPAAGSDQDRDAGERGNRGDRGDPNRRGRRGRGSESGNSDSSTSPSSGAAAKTSPAPATPPVPEVTEAERTRTWAKELIQKHDKNGDMMLQESEWEGLGQSTRADANGDHVITLDELVAFALRKPGAPSTNAGTSAATATSSGSDAKGLSSGASSNQGDRFVNASSHSSSDSKRAKDRQKSYRFKTAKERLPAGLPSWFIAKDANGDGQVSMSEYSKSWTESQAAEFKRYDKNNDGIITAEEAMKK